MREARTTCSRALAAVPSWKGTAQQLRAVSAPLEETIRNYEREYAELAANMRALEGKVQENDNQKKRLLREIEGLSLHGEIPTDERLREERAARDRGWQLIRRVVFTKDLTVDQATELYEPPAALDGAYESHLRKADELADSLRTNASRVVEFRTKQKELRERDEDRIGFEDEVKTTKNEQDALSARWTEEWPAIDIALVRSPSEMRGWTVKRELALKAYDEACAKEEALEEQRQRVSAARQSRLRCC